MSRLPTAACPCCRYEGDLTAFLVSDEARQAINALAHTNPVGQLPGPLSYKLLDQFTMPMLPTEPQCTNVIACI